MSPEYATPAGMSRRMFRAMGTDISLLLPERQAERGLQIVYLLFLSWERTLSRFMPGSELSQLNERAGTTVVVSDLLSTVLRAALEAARETDGVYDPTLLKQLVRLGYDRSFDQLPKTQAAAVVVEEPGGNWRNIRVSETSRRVSLPAGLKLDFGGIAKGMAVDAALEELRLHGMTSALINAGGDLTVLGWPPNAEQWPLAIPGRKSCWTLPLRWGALATSGIAHRHWQQGEERRHHLLDPRTGLSAQSDLWSVTVVADDCKQAEIAAKVAFILGSQEGAAFLRKQQLAGLLIHEDGTWSAVEPWPVQLMKEEKR